MYDSCLTGVISLLVLTMKRITLRLPDQQIALLEELVRNGEFPTVSEAVRDAVRELLQKRAGSVKKESEDFSLKV